MVDTDRLRGLMAQNRLSQGEVAQYMGISPATLSRKMQSGVFNTNECEKLITLLKIKDPTIFFKNMVN